MWHTHKKKLGREGFQDMELGEIQDLRDITPEELAEDDLMEMSIFKQVLEEEEEDVEVAVLERKVTLGNLAEGSDDSHRLLTSI